MHQPYTIKTALRGTPVQQNYQRWLAKWLLGTGAAGVTMGVLNPFAKNSLPGLIANQFKDDPEPPEPTVINVPYRLPSPEDQESSSKRLRGPSLMKTAKATDWAALDPKWWMGNTAETPFQIPMAWPATLLGGMGMGIGGYALAQKGMGALRSKQREDEIEDAKRKYETALLGQFMPLPANRVRNVALPKLAADSSVIKTLLEKSNTNDPQLTKLANDLDALADKVLEKQSQNGWFDDYIGHPARVLGRTGAGMYATLAAALAGTSGVGMYNYISKNDPNRALAEALKKQRDERNSKRPSDVYARLIPVDQQNKPLFDYQPGELKQADTKLKDEDINKKADAFVKELFGA